MTEDNPDLSPDAPPNEDGEALEKAFEALTKYDWGEDPQKLKAIDDAVLATYDAPASRSELEVRLAGFLKTPASRVAKGFVCRKLRRIGTAASVPALADLLTEEGLSHMARYALEHMPCREATAALRGALPKLSGRIRIGVINSLGVRRDAGSTARLIALLDDSSTEVAAAAAAALGQIATSQTAAALLTFQRKVPDSLRLAAADACLVCAGQLEDEGIRDQAIALYRALRSDHLPDHVRFAAERGLRNATGENESNGSR